MEDRHTVSDPRPVDNSTVPSWTVDILRDNSVIVDTILLNNSTLPPRKNKRGKVLWRLPDSLDRIVSSLELSFLHISFSLYCNYLYQHNNCITFFIWLNDYHSYFHLQYLLSLHLAPMIEGVF